MRLVMFRGRWHLITGEGASRRRTSLRTADREEAERRVADYRREEAELAGGTVAEIYAAYIADRLAIGKSVATAEHSWKSLRPVFAALLPSQVDRERCRGYVARRKLEKRAKGTITRELGVLRAALRWHSKATPAVIETPGSGNPRETHITKAEFLKLRESAAATPHLKVFVELAKATGARAGAIVELTWSRIDFDRGIIRLGADVGGKRRATIPMVDSLREVLEEAREGSLTPYAVEFSGGPVKSVKTAFKKAARRIGRGDIGPHTIRHSVAVWMAEEGISMEEIADYLGHADIKITRKHYARFSPTYLRRAGSVVDF